MYAMSELKKIKQSLTFNLQNKLHYKALNFLVQVFEANQPQKFCEFCNTTVFEVIL